MGRRPKRPKREFRGVEILFRGGRWRFRARWKDGGKIHVGQLRETQREAFADHERLTTQSATQEPASITLGDALMQERQRQLERREKINVERSIGGSIAFLLSQFDGDMPLRLIGKPALEWLVSKSIEKGRSANTARRYVQLVQQCLRTHGLEVPQPDIPKHERKLPEFFTAEELGSLLSRIRNSEFRHKERDAALMLVVATTGIRQAEFCRIQVRDIDFVREEIRIRSKDASHPRIAAITDLNREPLKMLVSLTKSGLLCSSKSAWNSLFRRWSDRLEVKINGRKLRHTFVTMAAESGLALTEVQRLAGHKHATTTDRYIQLRAGTTHQSASAVSSWYTSANLPKEQSTSPDDPPDEPKTPSTDD